MAIVRKIRAVEQYGNKGWKSPANPAEPVKIAGFKLGHTPINRIPKRIDM